MLKRLCAAAAIAAVASAAHAQSQPQADVPGPAAPSPARASAFEGYRPYRDEALAPWREVNDEVGRVGGHSGVVRADRQAVPPSPLPVPSPPSGPAQPPAPAQSPGTKR